MGDPAVSNGQTASHDGRSSTSSGQGAHSSALRDASTLDAEKADTVAPATNDGAFPDGGARAWLVVAGAFACLFSSFGWINAIGVFQTQYEKQELRQYSPSTIAWIPALEVFMMFAGGPLAGALFDRYGPRWILLVGSFLHVFGLFMTSISSKYYQYLLSQGAFPTIPHPRPETTCLCRHRGLQPHRGQLHLLCSHEQCRHLVLQKQSPCVRHHGLRLQSGGSDLPHHGATRYRAERFWLGNVRSFAFAITFIKSRIGFTCLTLFLHILLTLLSRRASAFLILGLQVFANLTVKSRLAPKPSPLNFSEFLKPYLETPFLLTVLASFMTFFGLFLPFTFVILSAEHFGMSSRLAGYLLAILNAVSILGRTIPGAIADRMGRFNTMIVMAFLSTILVLALWLPARGNVAFILFAALYGFSSGAFVSLAPALIAQISEIRQIGVRTGSMFIVVSVAALVGNPIGGQLIHENHGGYLHLQIFCGIMMLAGSILFVCARISLAGFKLCKV